MSKTIFLDKDISVLIVSAGGVGTTFLINEIGKYKQTNCMNNTDGFKHMPIPPISWNKNLRVIYVFGNPIHACISLFRRQYHHTQSIVVQKFLKKKYIIPFEMNLEEYASKGKDGLLFENHLKNWHTQYQFYPTLFIKYENIHDSLDKLADFLSLPKSFIDNFPVKKVRQSTTKDLPNSLLKGLNKLYYFFNESIYSMPKCMESPSQKTVFSIKTLQSTLYRQALKDAFLKKFPLLRKILKSLQL